MKRQEKTPPELSVKIGVSVFVHIVKDAVDVFGISPNIDLLEYH